MVKKLLSRSAEVDLCAKENVRNKFNLVFNYFSTVIYLILFITSNPRSLDPICIIPFLFQDKDTPLIIANRMGRSDVVSALVQHGAKLDVCGEVCEGEG